MREQIRRQAFKPPTHKNLSSPHPQNCFLSLRQENSNASRSIKFGTLAFYAVLIALFLLQPTQAYNIISLQNLWFAQQLKLLYASMPTQGNVSSSDQMGLIAEKPYQNGSAKNSLSFSFTNSAIGAELPHNSSGQQIKVQFPEQNYSQIYHACIYPYLVYEVKNMNFKQLHRIMRESHRNQMAPENSSIFTNTIAKQEESSAASYLPNSQLLISQLFLLQKIPICTTAQACRYLPLLPDNLALVADTSNQHLNFFKIGPTEFVLESMISSEPSVDPPDLSKAKAKAWNQEEMKGQKTEVHFYSLNINVFLFSKLIQKRESVRVSDEKIFRKFKIFQIQENQDARWDVTHNGSSFRFVKLGKLKFPDEQNNSIRRVWSKKEIGKITVPPIQKMGSKFVFESQGIASESIEGAQQKNEVRVTNILHMVEHSIIMYQEAKHYFTKFYSFQAPLQKKPSHQFTYRKSMIGITKNNFFFLFFTRIGNSQNTTRIFSADLHKIQLIKQLTNFKNKTANSSMEKIIFSAAGGQMLYYENGQAKLRRAQQAARQTQQDQRQSRTKERRESEKVEKTMDQKEIAIYEKEVYLDDKAYADIQMFRYLHACRLMETKLKLMFSDIWDETVEEQQDNCHLMWNQPLKNTTNFTVGSRQLRQLVGVSFKEAQKTQQGEQNQVLARNWKICRIAIDSGNQNLVIAPSPSLPVSRPYLLFRCSLYSSALSKCNYHEWVGDTHSRLPQNSKSVLFIINQGQSYDLNISDMSSVEMDRVAESFLLIFFFISAVACMFICLILCRPIYLIICLRLGFARPEAEPNFRYPLNWLQLRFKLHSMATQSVIKWGASRSQKSVREDQEQDDCIFCLEPKSGDEALVEVYCKHSYHRECFQLWVKQERGGLSCPICKRRLNAQGLQAYQQQAQLIV